MVHTPQSLLQPGNRERLRTAFPGLDQLAGQVAASSLQEYETSGLYYLAWCAWDSDRAREPQTLRAWRQHLVQETTLSPNTINVRLAAIKSLVKASATMGAFPAMLSHEFRLVGKVKLSTLRHRLRRATHRRYTPAEVRRLCQAPNPLTLVGLRDRALLHTMASSGCRIAEVLRLTREHIVAREHGYGIQVLGKGQETERLAPLSREAYTWIARWLTARDRLAPSAWVFTGCGTHGQVPNTTPLTTSAAWRRVKCYGRLIGEPISPHDLRRFVGTETAERLGLRQAQKVLGHQALSTTEQYYVLDSLQPETAEGLY